jgi:inner membrane protein
MDSLTQIVLGAAVGEATLGKKAGNKALFYGAIAGTIPDLDVFVGRLTDTITAIEWHRGFSHSIVFCIVMSPLLGWLVNKIERKSNLGWKLWAFLFFWGLFTHSLLDVFTTWGTQLFWPLDFRLAFNSIFVIDPFYTLPFLILTSITLFKKKGSKIRTNINRFSLFLSSFYLINTLVVKSFVNMKFESALEEQGIEYKKLSSRPAPFSVLLWNTNIETEDAYLIGDYSFFDTQPIKFTTYPKNRSASAEIESYQNVQRLIDISKNWYIINKVDAQWVFNDLRFGLIPQMNGEPYFAFSYILDEKDGKIYATEVEKTRDDAEYVLETLISRIKGN